MVDILKRMQNEKKYVCIHADETNPSKFIFGKIIGTDPDNFAISMVSPDGEYDGVLVKQIDDIVCIEQSVSYESKMKMLMDIRGHVEKKWIVNSENVLQWGLISAKKMGMIVSIELNHSGVDDVVGFVDSINDKICKMVQINEYGEEDGASYFALRNISQLCFDSCDERRILLLNRSK